MAADPNRVRETLTNAHQDELDRRLLSAVQADKVEQVREALTAGADVNKVSGELLYVVIAARRTELVKVLIGAGVDVNLNIDNKSGITLLSLAILRNNIEIAGILLAAGANAKDNDNVTSSEGMRNLLTLYAITQALWPIWELETPLFSSYLQWLPQEILEDVIAWLKVNALPQPSLGNSKPSFFSNSTVPQEGEAADQLNDPVEQSAELLHNVPADVNRYTR